MKIRANRRSDNASAVVLALRLTAIACACLIPVARAEEPRENAEAFAARGAILVQACDYEAAEVLLDRALELQPELWNAQFNRARIPLLKRDWTEARHRFEAMLTAAGGDESEQLIQYEILLTHLLAGEETTATQIVKQLERNPESDALRYARAALAWQQGAAKEAENLSAAARQRASDPLAPLYAESFFDVGWIRKVRRAAQLGPNEQGSNPALLSVSDQP